MLTRLLLVRHGETDDNHRRVFQGQGGKALNARGREQAKKLAERLVAEGAEIDALVSSDLERARETAAILGDALGLTPSFDPGLREVDVGGWEGLDFEAVAATFPEEWTAWRAGHDLKRGGTGETYVELAARVRAAIDRTTALHEGKTVLVVSHGAALKSFAISILGAGPAGMIALRVSPNTGVSLVERSSSGNGHYTLITWGDATHLGDRMAPAVLG